MINSFIEANILFFTIIFFSSVVAITFIKYILDKDKILVRIKSAFPEKTKKVKLYSSNEVILQRENKNKNIPEWKVEFNSRSLYDTKTRFGVIKTLDVMNDSAEAYTWDFETGKIESPLWNKKQAVKFINAKILERQGEGFKMQIPIVIYLVVILQIATLFLVYLMSKGFGIGI